MYPTSIDGKPSAGGFRMPHQTVRVSRTALLQSPAAWLSVCVICSERLRHERIQGTSLSGGNRALGRTLVNVRLTLTWIAGESPAGGKV